MKGRARAYVSNTLTVRVILTCELGKEQIQYALGEFVHALSI